MTKISNTNAYPFDTEITGDEYLVGTEPDGSVQNQTKSFKLSDIKGYILGYKGYVANLSQTGTSAPIATVMVNEIGDITLSRVGAGEYAIASSNLFVNGKTTVNINNSTDGDVISASYDAADLITITTSGDNQLSNTTVEIRVYS
jgi:hypothetical protein